MRNAHRADGQRREVRRIVEFTGTGIFVNFWDSSGCGKVYHMCIRIVIDPRLTYTESALDA